MDFAQLLLKGLSLAFLDSLGFQDAPSSSLPEKLESITPSGGTAFRDSVS